MESPDSEEIEAPPKGHMEELRKWLSTQPHLPSIPEKMLHTFHHSCYFDQEKTKDCIDTYYTLRANVPDIFSNRNIVSKDLQVTVDNVMNVIIPKKTPDGCTVIFQRIESTDYSKYNFEEACKLYFMAMDTCILRDGPTAGYMVLLDYKNVRLGHLAKTSISSMRKMFKYIQEGAPIRLKSIHMINMNYFIEKVMSFVKPFMNKELYSLIHFYQEGEQEKLHTFIPTSCLPSDYGGELSSSIQLRSEYIAKMKDMTDYFAEEEVASRVKETLRPKKSKKKKKESEYDRKEEDHLSLKTLELD